MRKLYNLTPAGAIAPAEDDAGRGTPPSRGRRSRGSSGISRAVRAATLATAVLVSALGTAAVGASTASAHTPSHCVDNMFGNPVGSHQDWHTVRFHYDYHHMHHGTTSFGSHYHQAHNHTHGYYYWMYGC